MPTARQLEIYLFIKYFISTNSYSPTLRDIADEFDFNVSAAKVHIERMQKKHMLKYTPKIARSIVLLK
jgi:repressor LexA